MNQIPSICTNGDVSRRRLCGNIQDLLRVVDQEYSVSSDNEDFAIPETETTSNPTSTDPTTDVFGTEIVHSNDKEDVSLLEQTDEQTTSHQTSNDPSTEEDVYLLEQTDE